MADTQQPDNARAERVMQTGNPFPLRVRIVQIAFLIAAVIATLFLARWQWDVWQSNGGTFQNLGYAIQWPLFGVFFVVAYRKYIHYEKERALGNDEAAVPDEVKNSMTEVPDDFFAQRTEPVGDHWQDTRRRDRRISGASKSQEDAQE
ncbi:MULTISPECIES: hypothetical protein [Corynebacterium]|uniref:hypothetical protein n=1 Tax=Corynebacterium TaxID=1716 RepID=UPI000A85F3C9|nr:MULTISPECIES: hypothetical protein [Corynebacterium]MCX2163314.1 hypothetical protein [Corynebacterium auriscanis]